MFAGVVCGCLCTWVRVKPVGSLWMRRALSQGAELVAHSYHPSASCSSVSRLQLRPRSSKVHGQFLRYLMGSWPAWPQCAADMHFLASQCCKGNLHRAHSALPGIILVLARIAVPLSQYYGAAAAQIFTTQARTPFHKVLGLPVDQPPSQ